MTRNPGVRVLLWLPALVVGHGSTPHILRAKPPAGEEVVIIAIAHINGWNYRNVTTRQVAGTSPPSNWADRIPAWVVAGLA